MIRSNLLSALGFTIIAGLGVPACMVSGGGAVGVRATTPVVYQEPPPPQAEEVTVRPGHVWIRGRWDWRDARWQWVGGHWERERAGHAWQEGRWERRGDQWHWIEGTWAVGTVDTGNASGGVTVSTTHTETHHGRGDGGGVVDTGDASGGVVVSGGANPMYPTAAPPPLRVESYGAPRAGFIWVSGRWDWRNGQWAWVDGHWERQRARQSWIAGRWELQGNYYVWIEGRWDAQPAAPVVRDHR